MFYYWCTAKITLIGFHIYLLPNDGLTSVHTAISLGEGGGWQESDVIPYCNFRVPWCSKQVEGMLCEEVADLCSSHSPAT